MSENKTEFKSAAFLFLAAFIWGIAFVSQRVGMDYMEPFTFNGVRSFIGGIILLPVIRFMDQKNPDRNAEKMANKNHRNLLITGGILCGSILFAATSLQQIGLKYTSVGKAGFITALYIIVVPIIGLFIGKKEGFKLWIGVALAVLGLYFLTMSGDFSLGKGDAMMLACAIIFAFHIISVDYLSPRVDGVRLSCLQFFVCGFLSLIVMLVFEHPTWEALWAGIIPLLYAGVLSCGVAYTLQILGQEKCNPTIAALIMSLESVFSVLAGWVILGQHLSVREIFGCVLMFAAIVLVQVQPKKEEQIQSNNG